MGTVDGAQFRMKMPASWNRSLVLAAGGYSPEPVAFTENQDAGPFAAELVQRGYAYAETGYSTGGLGIAEAIGDVRALRQHFVGRYGNPQRTFIVGESKGGLVAVVLVESSPAEFHGALAISGLLSTPYVFFSRAFDLVVRFEEDFPGVLPAPTEVPNTYAASEQMVTNVLQNLGERPHRAEALRTLAGVRSDQELAELLAFHTEALGDLQRRCGGNAFNRHIEPNLEVSKSSVAARGQPLANPDAERCVRGLPGPTGNLQRPLLAVNTAYDPVIPSSSTDDYVRMLQDRSRTDLFMREVVQGEGHLAVSLADRLRMFSVLVRWSTEGVRPAESLH